jgi:hypothetical protein
MMLTLMSAFILTANAAQTTTPIDLWNNPPDTSGNGWKWVRDTQTLTLNNLDLMLDEPGYPNHLPAGSTLVLNGSNSIVNTGGGVGIYSPGALTINGSGSLTIDSWWGMDIRGTLTINGGGITGESDNHKRIISDDSTVVTIKSGDETESGDRGIRGNLSIRDGAFVSVTSVGGAVTAVTGMTGIMQGILIQQNYQGYGEVRVSGEVTLDRNMTRNEHNFFINNGILTIPSGVTLINDGLLENYGIINVLSGGTLTQNGDVISAGVINNSGTVNGANAGALGVQTAPGKPVITAVTPGDRQITVVFTPPSSGAGPVSYLVTALPTGAGSPVIETGTSSPITVAGLTNGMGYTVSITAFIGTTPGDAAVYPNTVTPSFGSPPTGIAYIKNTVTAMFAFIIISAGLWGYMFRRRLKGLLFREV